MNHQQWLNQIHRMQANILAEHEAEARRAEDERNRKFSLALDKSLNGVEEMLTILGIDPDPDSFIPSEAKPTCYNYQLGAWVMGFQTQHDKETGHTVNALIWREYPKSVKPEPHTLISFELIFDHAEPPNIAMDTYKEMLPDSNHVQYPPEYIHLRVTHRVDFKLPIDTERDSNLKGAIPLEELEAIAKKMLDVHQHITETQTQIDEWMAKYAKKAEASS